MNSAVTVLTLLLAGPPVQGPGIVLLEATQTGSNVPLDLSVVGEAIRQAAIASDLRVYSGELGPGTSPGCTSQECLHRYRVEMRCEYAVTTTVSTQAGQLTVRLALIQTATGEPLRITMNSGRARFGLAGLDLKPLAQEMFSSLSLSQPSPTLAHPYEDHPATSPPSLMRSVEARPVVLAEPSAALDDNAASSEQRNTKIARRPTRRKRARPDVVGPCHRYEHLGGSYWFAPKDWLRYRRYFTRNPGASSPLDWAAKQNKESMTLNFVWATPPSLLVLGAIATSGTLALIGLLGLPVAAIAGLIDSGDIGSVQPCAQFSDLDESG